MILLIEVLTSTIILILAVRFLYISQHISFVGSYYATIFAILFLYVPVMVMWWRKRKIDFLDNSPKTYLRSIGYFLATALIIFPPYLILAHFWMVIVYGHKGFYLAPYPDLLKTIVFQTLLIALPEEFFFRGYMQTTFNQIFKPRWRIFGANLSWAWPLTAVIFAFCHSFVHFQWWHFSIFFPALVFGWLRERTGTITAGILFHALCNILSDYIARCYY